MNDLSVELVNFYFDGVRKHLLNMCIFFYYIRYFQQKKCLEIFLCMTSD